MERERTMTALSASGLPAQGVLLCKGRHSAVAPLSVLVPLAGRAQCAGPGGGG